MKILLSCAALLLLMPGMLIAQVAGNANYHSRIRFSENNINIGTPGQQDVYLTVKGMANVKPDAYVAIFSVTQTAQRAGEVDSLLEERLAKAISSLPAEGLEIYIDMISFVPVYEYEVEKKIFRKDTYNEIPAGFELKKNIHLKYTDPNLLNKMISAFAAAEIYDLVRVDYFANNLDEVKAALAEKAQGMLKTKVANYTTLTGERIDSFNRQVMDGYRVLYPTEQYSSYQAYSNSSLNLRKAANVQDAAKSTTLFYQPVFEKEFDFVENPQILEPTIQVMYEVKVRLARKPTPVQTAPSPDKEYIFITPNGDLKHLGLN